MNPALSTMDIPTDTAAEAPLEDLPVVKVYKHDGDVVVKWGQRVSEQAAASPDIDYTRSFHAIDSNGDELFLKTYHNLLLCSGGVLTIRQTSYCIQAQQQQQQPNDEASALPSHFTPVLLKLAVNGMDGWDKTTSQRTNSESSEVRRATVAFCGLSSNQHCQILGENTKHVVDTHIWPHHNRGNLVLVELSATDIDDPKNILRLHKNIEGFFDHKQLTITQSGTDFLLKVLDPSIRKVMLKGTNVTLNNIEGKPLVFPNNNRPWRCLLATHSIISLKHARKQLYWLKEDKLTAAKVDAQELMEFSLDAEAHARVRRFLHT